jgi:flagellar protein FliO/FliZ
MSQAWVLVIVFVAVLALIPVSLKWLQRRIGAGGIGATASIRIISAVGVGPHQRVVTVEIGPEGARTWLTLGVTGQSITCLHSAAAVSQPVQSTTLTVASSSAAEI